MSKFREKYGPWALVTGASSGLGAEFARQLGDRGLNLVLVARRLERLGKLAEEIGAKDSLETRVVSADLSQSDFMPKIRAATDGLEIGLLVNNAGIGLTGDFLGNPLEAELGQLDLNCRAPLALTHRYAKPMKERGRGGIIFLSSTLAFAGVPDWSNYAATKGYDLLLAEGLARELRPFGLDVLAVCPGVTRTEFMSRISRFGRIMSMDPRAVVRTALDKLGKRKTVTAGFLNKVVVFSTRFQPRSLNSRIFGRVMEKIEAS